MILPALCIGKKSYTWFIVSEVEMTKMSICDVELVRGNLKVMRIFDYSGKEWRCVACNTEKKLPWLRHFSTKVLFREVNVTLRFEQVGPYSLDALKGVLAAAVEKDDDILTQHEEASEILEKLRRTASLGEVFNLYRWMTKDFRKYDAPTAGRPVSP